MKEQEIRRFETRWASLTENQDVLAREVIICTVLKILKIGDDGRCVLKCVMIIRSNYGIVPE